MFTTEPFYSPRPWGYELWTLSTHRSGQSLVLPDKTPLKDYLKHDLPILIKTIKANEPLSVQVHPDDAYAREHENDNGKTECWYILEAEPGAKLIAGIQEGMDRESMARAIEENRLEEVVEYIDVKPGDMVFIPAGTVHAIMGGITLMEIQQSSDSTYRMYDWGRKRDMHIAKALDVIDYEGKNHPGKMENFKRLDTDYFHVEKVDVKDSYSFDKRDDFQTINIISGLGTVCDEDGKQLEFQPGHTIYIPAHTAFTVFGDVSLLHTWQK